MEDNLVKLLTYKDDKLLIEGYDLMEIANMFELSVKDFLFYFKSYLLNLNSIVPTCKISSENILHIQNNAELHEYKGEIIVEGSEYERLKRMIFDLAYTRFSNIKKEDIDRTFSLDDYELVCNLINTHSNYRCIYKNSNFSNVIRLSNIPIDKNDQEKRYSLIRRG